MGGDRKQSGKHAKLEGAWARARAKWRGKREVMDLTHSSDSDPPQGPLQAVAQVVLQAVAVACPSRRS